MRHMFEREQGRQVSEIVSASERGGDKGCDDRHDPVDQLLIPDHDVANPEVSIVVPAVNERLTISEFVSWCKEGLREAGVCGEVLIVDSSDDGTAELALAGGARVLRTPKRGLGAHIKMRFLTFAGDTS